jgi:signal peptidase I
MKSNQNSAAEEDISRWESFKSNTRTIGGAVLLAIFIRVVLFEAFEIDGPSMQPTLLDGDRVVVEKVAFGLFLPFQHEASLNWGMPDPGDIVIVNSPLDGVDIVKRVIGVPGDTIEVREHIVYRNGDPLPQRDLGPCEEDAEKDVDESCHIFEETLDGYTYRTSRGAYRLDPEQPPITLGPGEVFVMGDHRDSSNDSRRIGPIPVTRVKGRALVIYMSIDRTTGWRGSRAFSVVD